MTHLPPQSPMGALAENFELLVDRSVGIVNRLEETPVPPGEPQFFHFSARACNTSAFVDQRNFHNTGGASTKRLIAVSKAIGEAAERYCAAIYCRDDLPLGAVEDGHFATIAPGDFALHSEAQYAQRGFPWAPFDETTLLRWTPVTDLETGAVTHAPAAMVWIPYVYDRAAGEVPIVQPISTGLACHQSYARSCLSGLSEVLERDAFTLCWLARTAPPRIRVETLPDESYDAVERFEVTGDQVAMFDITTDNGVPCFLSVLMSASPERPTWVFAASCDLDPAVAALKSLEELAHTRRYSQQIHSNLPRVSPDDDWRAVTGQLEHLNAAGDHANRHAFDFLFASKKRVDFDAFEDHSTGSAETDLEACVRRVRDTGYRAYAADLTSPDVQSLGLRVTRVLVPGYHPLFLGHNIRALGGTRLYEVPQDLGYPGIATADEANPFPHPYP